MNTCYQVAYGKFNLLRNRAAQFTLKQPIEYLYILLLRQTILLWLTPDDVTRQCGTSGPVGVNNYLI